MPLARHDWFCKYTNDNYRVSTHMPLARHDDAGLSVSPSYTFLLTCLLRGMTAFLDSGIDFVRFLLTCLLRGMTFLGFQILDALVVSTHMPLARHDSLWTTWKKCFSVSTHMPLARHGIR